MKMSASYLAETMNHLQKNAYVVTKHSETKYRAEILVFHRTTYRCVKSPEIDIALEALSYPDGREAYYLEIFHIGPLRSLSFPLDSWKIQPTYIEFKYYSHPQTAMGLAFTLDL